MQESKIKKNQPDKKYRRILSAGTLSGDSVRNSAGEDLGEIDEIMIDIPSGRVAYAVLSFGGILNMGNKLFAVPWSALRVDEDEKCFILDVDAAMLESAPGFDKNDWPDMADPPGDRKCSGSTAQLRTGKTREWRRRCAAAVECSRRARERRRRGRTSPAATCLRWRKPAARAKSTGTSR